MNTDSNENASFHKFSINFIGTSLLLFIVLIVPGFDKTARYIAEPGCVTAIQLLFVDGSKELRLNYYPKSRLNYLLKECPQDEHNTHRNRDIIAIPGQLIGVRMEVEFEKRKLLFLISNKSDHSGLFDEPDLSTVAALIKPGDSVEIFYRQTQTTKSDFTWRGNRPVEDIQF